MSQYVVTVVAIGAITIAGIVGMVFVLHGGQNEQNVIILGILTAFLAPTVASLITVLKTFENKQKIEETHNEVQKLGEQLNGEKEREVSRARIQGYNEGAARARKPEER